MEQSQEHWELVAQALKDKAIPEPFTPKQLERVQKWDNQSHSQRMKWKREPRKYSVKTVLCEKVYSPVPSEFYLSLAEQLTEWIERDPDSRHDSPFSPKQWFYVNKVLPDDLEYLHKQHTHIQRTCPVCECKIDVSSKTTDIEHLDCKEIRWNSKEQDWVEMKGHPSFLTPDEMTQYQLDNAMDLSEPKPKPEPDTSNPSDDIILDDFDDQELIFNEM